MIAERTLRVLVLLVAAGGCTPQSAFDPGPDAAPIIMYDPLTSHTWSLSIMGSAAQLSITDGSGPAACALSADQRRGLGAAGGQIILRLPVMATDMCPALVSGYELRSNCPATLGSEAYVPEGCAFYRRWDAQGAPLGITVALNGVIKSTGNGTSCTIYANVGFLGAAFSEMVSLTNGTGAQPWCKDT